MKANTTLINLGLIALLASCSMAELESGKNVLVVSSVDEQKCQSLGQVFGKGGGMFGGAWLSDNKLMEYASNDLRNKAYEKGATHIVAGTHQMGQTTSKNGGTTSTATIAGIAYKCN